MTGIFAGVYLAIVVNLVGFLTSYGLRKLKERRRAERGEG